MKHLMYMAAVLSLFFFEEIHAQDNSPAMFMHHNIANLQINPANPIPNGSFYLGFPALSNVSAAVQNDFSYNNLFKQSDDKLVMTPSTMLEKLKKNNLTGINVSEEIFNVGFSIKDDFFLAFGMKTRANAEVNYPDDLIRFLVKGNTEYVDKPLKINNLTLSAQSYVEFSTMLQYNYDNKLRIAFRPKLLFGLVDLKTEKTDVEIITDKDYNFINMTGDLFFKTSSIYNFFNDSVDNPYIKNVFSNVGFAGDIGITYNLNDKWLFGLSVLDLGFIKYKSNNYDLQGAGSAHFSGIEIKNLDSDLSIQGFADSLLSKFNIDTIIKEKNITAVKSSVLLHASYHFNDHHSLSAAFRTDFFGGKAHFYETVGYTGYFFNSLEVAANVYMFDRSVNAGLSLGYHLARALYVYVSADNMQQVSIRNTKNLNVNFGLLVHVIPKTTF